MLQPPGKGDWRPAVQSWAGGSPLQVLAGAGVKPPTIQRGNIPDLMGPENEGEWMRCSRFYVNGGNLGVYFKVCQYLA